MNFETVAGSAKDGINSIIDAFKGLFEGENALDFTQIRESLTGGISTLLTGTDFDGLTDVVAKGVKAVIGEFGKLATDILAPDENNETLGAKLAASINKIFQADDGTVDLKLFEGLGQNIGTAIKGVFSNIKDWISKTDWEAIGSAVGSALGEIDWFGIAGQIVSLLWEGLLAAVKISGGLIGSFITNLFGLPNVATFDATTSKWAGAFGASFDQSMLNEFQSGEHDETVAKVAALAATGLNDSFIGELELQQGYASEAATSAINNIFADVQQQLLNEGVDFDEDALAKEFYDSIGEAIASGDREKIISVLEHFGYEWNESLINSLLAGQDNVAEAGRQLIASLQRADTIEETKAAFEQAGIDVSDAFAQAIGGTGTDNIAAALMLLGIGVDQATIAAMDTSHLSENLSAYMEKSGADLTTIATDLGAQVGDGIGFTIPKAIAEALGIGTKEVERVKGEMVEVASASASDVSDAEQSNKELGEAVGETSGAIAEETETVKKNTAEMVGGITETISENKENVGNEAKSVGTTIDDALKDLPDEEKKHAESMMAYIVQGIADGDELVQTTIGAVSDAVVERVRDTLASDVGYNIALDFVNGMHNGIRDNFSNVSSYLTESCWTVVELAHGALSEANGKAIGSNMVIGMINGMNEYGQTLVDTISHICEVSADTAREILGIASPSKVFAEIGGYTMEGMQIGLQESGEDAISTVAGIAQAIVDEAENGNSISMKVNAMTDGLDTVEGKMSRIADIFSAIANTITEMGGFEIPTVASGRVLPYRAKVDAEPNVTENNIMSDRNALEDSLYAAFMRAMGNNSNEQVIRVYLDGRDISDAVTKYQRQQQRAWGV